MENNIPKISLIIPVYNVEKYLAECLDSCINQTLKDIEIICVNDCSPDNSALILKEYAEKDSRVRIINHEINKGLGAARNTGIDNATGEYIWFIDSDDFVDLISCQVLYDCAKEHDVEILLFQGKTFIDEQSGKKYIENEYYNDLPKQKNIDVKQNKYYEKYIPVSSCMYISKTSFMKQFKFREGVYYEDTDFSPILFHSSKCMRSITFSLYNRRITPGSITQEPLDKKKWQDRFLVLKSLENFLIENKLSKKNIVYSNYRGLLGCFIDEIKNNENYLSFVEEDYSCYLRKLKKIKFIEKISIVSGVCLIENLLKKCFYN